jgi:hypothetical protein
MVNVALTVLYLLRAALGLFLLKGKMTATVVAMMMNRTILYVGAAQSG